MSGLEVLPPRRADDDCAAPVRRFDDVHCHVAHLRHARADALRQRQIFGIG
ncbi:MAG: hypothetical protein ABIP19_12835 [Dermatophilaceae bacterium]